MDLNDVMIGYTGEKSLHRVEIVDSNTGELLAVKRILTEYRHDFNYDKVIDIEDMAIIAKEYNKMSEGDGIDLDYKYKYDFNSDGIIDIYDLVLLSKKAL